MEYLLHIFGIGIDMESQAGAWIFAAIFGIAAALLGIALVLIVFGVINPFDRRLREVQQNEFREKTPDRFSLGSIVDPVATVALPRNAKETLKIKQKMVHAGFRGPQAVNTFYAVKLLLVIGAGFMVFSLAGLFPKFSTNQVVMTALLLIFIATFLPNVYLNYRMETRKKEVLKSFPDALDLLVSCTEAGLGLNAAVQRVSSELRLSHPILAEELNLVNSEMRAGVSRSDALFNLYERTGVAEIRGLVSLLSQSLRFGTSIAESLRIYAEEFRNKRLQKAEEVAAKLGVKMIFPIVLFIFPSFFVVAIGPAVIALIDAFSTG